jgi:hypothetical protein
MILWFDLDFAIWFAFDPSVLYPSIFLVMKVTWPWHWCTNVMTPVWSSDVPHRPFVWSAFGLGRGVWMHPRFALIWFATTFGLVSGTVCNTCLSQYLGASYSNLVTWGLPSYYIWYSEVTPLSTWLLCWRLWFDLICLARGRILKGQR